MTNYSKANYKDFWEKKYLTQFTPWDIGQAAPAFVKYFDSQFSIFNSQFSINVAVLGCGKGHDAFHIANLKDCKFNVYGFDFSENAIRSCNELKEKQKLNNVYFSQVNFFELVNDTKWENCFDIVIEHTSFCAIDPKRRSEYVDLIKYLLKPKGLLIGLFFVRASLSGPPYGCTLSEVRELFYNNFTETEKLHIEECLHKEKLEGDEYFGVFEKIIQHKQQAS